MFTLGVKYQVLIKKYDLSGMEGCKFQGKGVDNRIEEAITQRSAVEGVKAQRSGDEQTRDVILG